MKSLDPFQEKIISLLNEEPDSRKIIYVYDEKGNSGKSKLAKYLLFKSVDAILLPFDSANQIRSGIAKAERGHRIYIVNVPRTLGYNERKYFDDIFSVLESLKDGMVSSFFYGKFGQILFDIPHVIVFSNHKVDPSKLSLDRWSPYRISDDFDLLPVSLSEITEVKQKGSFLG